MKNTHATKVCFLAFLLVISGRIITATTASMTEDRKLVILHEQTFGGAEVEYNYAMINASDGGYIMAGHTSSFGAGLSDAWVVKVDIEGNHQWNSTFGGAESDVVISIIPTPDGGYAMTGIIESWGYGEWDAWLIKIDNEGQMQWNETYGGSERDYGGSLALTPDGGFIIFGYTESFALGDQDFYLIKTDNSGNIIWNKTYGGYGSERSGFLILTADEGFLLVGLTGTMATNTLDVWIVKTDSDGNQLWNRTIGGVNNDFAYAGISAHDGGYIITGFTESYGAGSSDAWLVKIDQNGNHEWNRTFGGPALDYTTTIIPTNDNGYVLAGRTMSYGAGGEDMWLIKTNALGELEFDQTFGGANADAAYGVVENGNEGYSLAGRTSSYGAGAEDIWFIRAVFETETADGFTYSIMITAIMLFIIIRVRVSRFDKKRICY
ncbi:MAG: hypothetical protein FK733_14425 [Asgard group archaeon]|nr:hypothetical protein [Asgard group archaeon]